MVNVKAVNLHESSKDMVNAALYGRNETSLTQDIWLNDSGETQPVVVLPQGLTGKDFTFSYSNIICATGENDFR